MPSQMLQLGLHPDRTKTENMKPFDTFECLWAGSARTTAVAFCLLIDRFNKAILMYCYLSFKNKRGFLNTLNGFLIIFFFKQLFSWEYQPSENRRFFQSITYCYFGFFFLYSYFQKEENKIFYFHSLGIC